MQQTLPNSDPRAGTLAFINRARNFGRRALAAARGVASRVGRSVGNALSRLRGGGRQSGGGGARGLGQVAAPRSRAASRSGGRSGGS
jgi:hypothetical protein